MSSAFDCPDEVQAELTVSSLVEVRGRARCWIFPAHFVVGVNRKALSIASINAGRSTGLVR
jgi:hypothetical protein